MKDEIINLNTPLTGDKIKTELINRFRVWAMRLNFNLFLIIINMSAYSLTGINTDSLKVNRIYINPTKCVLDDIVGSGNVYGVIGYSYNYSSFRFDVAAGPVIHHFKNENFIGVNQKNANGLFSSVEVDQLIRKFYIGIQLSYRYIKSVDYDNIKVNRETYSGILKLGRIFQLKRNFGIDIGFGLGGKLISSYSSDKKKDNLIREFPSGKDYYSGSGYYPCFLLLEIKLFKRI